MSIVPRRREAALGRAVTPLVAHHAVAHRPPSIAHRVVRRVLEGPHDWGALEIWGGRYGYTSSCLVVYPPGATRRARIGYRAMRGWPAVGLLLGLVATIGAARAVPLLPAVVAGCLVYAAGAVGLAAFAGRERRAIRVLQACRGDEGVSGSDRGPAQELDRFAALLIEAERRRRAGTLDAVGFEAAWGDVWRALGDARLHRP